MRSEPRSGTHPDRGAHHQPHTGVLWRTQQQTRRASMQYAFLPSTRCRKQIPAIRDYRSARPRWLMRSGRTGCASIRQIRRGSTGTASFSAPVTARRCSTRCCTCTATISRSTISRRSVSSAARRRAIPSIITPRASKSRPVRSARASPTPSASPSPKRTSPRRTTKARRSSITTRTCWSATATSWKASPRRRPRSPVTWGWASSSRSTTTTRFRWPAIPRSRLPKACSSGLNPTAGTPSSSEPNSPTTSRRSITRSRPRKPSPTNPR